VGPDAVGDDLRAHVVEHLGDPDSVLVVDETEDLKEGTATVGVERQHTGTAGRVENVQSRLASPAPPPAVCIHRPSPVSALDRGR
jgi:SRSO17 transposase